MNLPPFELERFFARWEFEASHVLCASDIEGWRLPDLVALADDECQALWQTLSLGYTESLGHPLLRKEIASLYDGVSPDEVVTFAGAEEAIFLTMTALLGPGDHAVVTWPGYQSLYEVARAAGADVTLLPLDEADGWALDLDALRRALRPNTRLIVTNFPHNPTGALPGRATFDALVALANEAGAVLFSDEVYRLLEFDERDRLPAAVEVSPSALSVGVMSKAWGLAGLRVGWLASHDAGLLARIAAAKDYTTICSAAPSEVLALVALRARETVLARNRQIVLNNLPLLDAFFARRPEFAWTRPRAGTVAFPRLAGPGASASQFADELVRETGVLILPGDVYGYPGDRHFRLGFGRTNLPDALDRLENFAQRRRGG